MTPAVRTAAAGLLLVVALVLQLTVLTRVPTAASPAPVLVVVVAVGLAGGGTRGAVAGFAGGLALDAWGDHPVGVLALVLTLVGYLAGGLSPAVQGRALVVPAAVVAGAAVLAPLLYAAVTVALGEPRATPAALARTVPLAVLYDLLLVPVVVPIVTALRGPSRRTRHLR